MIDHDRSDAKTSIWIQTTECHYVESSLVFRCIDTATNGAHHNIIVVCQFRQFARVQHINVKSIIVDYRKNHCVQFLQLLYIVRCHIAQFYRSSVTRTSAQNAFRTTAVANNVVQHNIRMVNEICMQIDQLRLWLV